VPAPQRVRLGGERGRCRSARKRQPRRRTDMETVLRPPAKPCQEGWLVSPHARHDATGQRSREGQRKAKLSQCGQMAGRLAGRWPRRPWDASTAWGPVRRPGTGYASAWQEDGHRHRMSRGAANLALTCAVPLALIPFEEGEPSAQFIEIPHRPPSQGLRLILKAQPAPCVGQPNALLSSHPRPGRIHPDPGNGQRPGGWRRLMSLGGAAALLAGPPFRAWILKGSVPPGVPSPPALQQRMRLPDGLPLHSRPHRPCTRFAAWPALLVQRDGPVPGLRQPGDGHWIVRGGAPGLCLVEQRAPPSGRSGTHSR
jgi:hypothetical protein